MEVIYQDSITYPKTESITYPLKEAINFPKNDTIITLEFKEENSQEDDTYLQPETIEENTEEGSTIESDASEELEMEQVPLGVKEFKTLKNNKETTLKVLVFNSEDQQAQTIGEMDLESDDEAAEEYAPQESEKIEADQFSEEDCSDAESIDKECMDNIKIVYKDQQVSKMEFKDVAEWRLQKITEKASIESDTESDVIEEASYNEELDKDFNPVYCDQTLSDVEVENADENLVTPEVVELADDNVMIKESEFVILPGEEEKDDGMECE